MVGLYRPKRGLLVTDIVSPPNLWNQSNIFSQKKAASPKAVADVFAILWLNNIQRCNRILSLQDNDDIDLQLMFVVKRIHIIFRVLYNNETIWKSINVCIVTGFLLRQSQYFNHELWPITCYIHSFYMLLSNHWSFICFEYLH